MEETHYGTESQCGTVTSANGSAICEMSSFISIPSDRLELDKIRRITGADRDTREGMVAGVKYLLKFLERAKGTEEATKKGQIEEFCTRNSTDVQDHPWPNGPTSVKAVLDMKAEGLNVELRTMGWHLFEKSKFDP